MTPERWQEIDTLARRLVGRGSRERRRLLEKACRGDSDLRRWTEQLVATYERARGADDTVLARAPEAPPPVVEVGVGDVLGAYRLVQVLGRGAMTSVFLAVREGRQVAIKAAVKVAERGFAPAPLHRLFEVERLALSRLDHPGIRRLDGHGELADGRPYLILEYVSGRPIDEYCDRRAASLAERLALFLDVGAAVVHAHDRGIVHRDLKPANVLVTDAGDIKLLDFGTARRLDGDEMLDAPSMTPPYASPEQLHGEETGPTSDVYSLGVMLFRLLTGHLPYGDETAGPREMIRRHAAGPPARPSAAGEMGSRRRLVPFDDILATALAHRPGERFQSVRELLRACAEQRV